MTTSDSPRVLLDVDGRSVCARLRQPRNPDASAAPIVLVAGGAGQGTEEAWGPELERRLAQVGPVLTYDRAGSGRSDGPQHSSVAGMAEELEQVLQAVGLHEPVILVGWSLGGHVVQGYALRYPDRVAGVVFVDPTPTEPPPRTRAVQLQLALVKPQMRFLALAARAGAFAGKLGERMATLMGGPDATAQTTALALRLLRSPGALEALATVMGRVPRYSTELEKALESGALPDVPAAVITAGKRGGVPEEYVANIRASHERLTARFSQGRLVRAERASHQVPFDDPEIIVETINSIAACR